MEHAILEYDPADGDADGLAHGAEEAEHGDCYAEGAWRGGGLDGERERREEEAEAEAGDEVGDDPDCDGAVWGDETHEAEAEGGEGPARPDGPAVAAEFGGDDADEDGAGGDGEGLWEEGDACHDGGVFFGGFVVEGEVV